MRLTSKHCDAARHENSEDDELWLAGMTTLEQIDKGIHRKQRNLLASQGNNTATNYQQTETKQNRYQNNWNYYTDLLLHNRLPSLFHGHFIGPSPLTDRAGLLT